MTPEQAAAFINAQVLLAQMDLQGMLAENQHRAAMQQLPAYTEGDFTALRDRWEPVLGYNAIHQLYRDCA